MPAVSHLRSEASPPGEPRQVEPHQNAWLARLRCQRMIAVIRSDDLQTGLKMADAAAQADVQLIEVTWNSDRPAQMVEQLRSQYPNCQIGVGTILSHRDLKDAIAAGAQFAFSPHTQPRLIEWGESQGCPMIPGALTPTEIVNAWQAGASSVKIFPAMSLGGPAYIKDLQGPLGQIPFVPTGGINYDNAPDFLKAGAIAVGVASCLFIPQLMKARDWPGLIAQIRQFRRRLETV